jgi:hypothetical protein
MGREIGTVFRNHDSVTAEFHARCRELRCRAWMGDLVAGLLYQGYSFRDRAISESAVAE